MNDIEYSIMIHESTTGKGETYRGSRIRSLSVVRHAGRRSSLTWPLMHETNDHGGRKQKDDGTMNHDHDHAFTAGFGPLGLTNGINDLNSANTIEHGR